MTESPNCGRVEGTLTDDHELTRRACEYGRAVVEGTQWPLSSVDLSKVEWATSSRLRRKNGYCEYGDDGHCTLTIGEHVYDRAGFDTCKETIRHELVHAWQHQHAGEYAVVTDAGATFGDEKVGVRIDPGHGPSFRAWVDPLSLVGRCSTPYEKTCDDYAYVFECPTCGDWWGRHRLCKSIRQAAHGQVGPAGYCFCVGCETLAYLREGDRYLDHGDHADEVIRSFAGGEDVAASVTAVDDLTPESRPVEE